MATTELAGVGEGSGGGCGGGRARRSEARRVSVRRWQCAGGRVNSVERDEVEAGC
jgi:hypothetical protein